MAGFTGRSTMALSAGSPPHKTQRTRSQSTDQESTDLTQTLGEILLDSEVLMEQDEGIPIKGFRRKAGRRVRIEEPSPTNTTPAEAEPALDNQPPQEEQTLGWTGDSGGTGGHSVTPVQPDPLRTDEADAPAGGTLPDPDLDVVMGPEGPAIGPTSQEQLNSLRAPVRAATFPRQ